MAPHYVAASIGLLLVGIVSPLQGQRAPDSVRLADIIVVGARRPEVARTRGSAADALGGDEAARRQIHSLQDALRLLPGAAILPTGAPGGVTSTFFRGVNSNQTLLLIDGVRVNDANTSAAALLGGLDFGPGERLEVVRGPQGTLYGGAAVGGVIALALEPGDGPVRWRLEGEGGRFSTYRLTGAARGTSGRFGLAVRGNLLDTQNQRPQNQFDQRTEAIRVDYAASARLRLTTTWRGQQQSYTSPGDIRTDNTTPAGSTDFDHWLATLGVELAARPWWTSRASVARQGYFIQGSGQFNGGPVFVSQLRTSRWVVDWQHRLAPTTTTEVVAGLNQEWTTVSDAAAGREERLTGVYAQTRIEPSHNLAITGGGRADHYSSFGTAITARVTAAVFLPGAWTKLRATLGSGFLPPSLASRFGGPFQRPNPEIRPEQSLGWDAGVDHFFARGRGVVSLTVFGNALRDLIGFEPAPFPELGKSINIDRAQTSGLELSGRLTAGGIDARLAYTYLEATNPDEPSRDLRRLIRRPRHALSVDLQAELGARWTVGAGLVAGLDRQDTDFNVFPFVRVNPGDFGDARLTGAWQAANRLRLLARVDNLFNRRYEEVYGFPTLGRRASVGAVLER